MSAQQTVVLLHSSLSNGRQWLALQHQLQQTASEQDLDFTYKIPDLSGYGSSPMPDNDRAQHQLAYEIAALAGQLPEQPFHLVGHSYGAAVALHFARQNPDRLLSLSLYEPVAFHLLAEDHPQRRAICGLSGQILDHLQQQNPQQAAACFIDYWNRPGTFDRLPQTMRQQFCQGIGKVSYDFNALLTEPCNPADLQSIRCPVLLLEGAETPASTHAVMQVLRDALPQASHHTLACGHMGPVTHPQQVNPLVSQFIATHNKAG